MITLQISREDLAIVVARCQDLVKMDYDALNTIEDDEERLQARDDADEFTRIIDQIESDLRRS